MIRDQIALTKCFSSYKINWGDGVKKHYRIIQTMIHAFNRINERSKTPRDYGTGDLLYQSEIHTLAAIQEHADNNASELSTVLGVTNGAITQVVNKLINKGLVEKFHLRGNRKDVYFHLTDKGKLAYGGHERYEAMLLRPLLNYLNTLDPQEIKVIETFFERCVEGIEE